MARIQLIITVAVGLLLAHRLHAAPDVSANEASARVFLGLVEKGEFAAAGKNFDETMTKALPPEKLADVWKTLNNQAGPFKKLGKARLEKTGEFEVVIVTCIFSQANLDARVAFKNKKISGLFFVPAQSEAVYEAPAYVKKDSFREVNVTVGTGEWALGGTLSLPVGTGPFPAVVLCQGSGPQDRDETIGPNKPLKDVAWGLASRGIAMLRFDRRAFTHGAKVAALLDKFTVKEEVIDDVNSAVALLKARPDIDAKRIFVLGHSLGAMLGPRMAQENADIHGLILLAGPARPLQDLIQYQFEYLASLQEKLSDMDREKLKEIKEQVARVSDPKLTPDTPAKDLPLGVPARYWLSLRGDSPPEAAGKLARPMLVLQGERDYQVPMVEFEMWKKALGGRKDVTLKSYPRLNHLFLEGAANGKSQPKEYSQPGHVPVVVIDDIAGWVKATR